MPGELPSLNALRVFEVAARLESFSRAAEELNVTQSAVSRQIQLLEAQLGTRLFERNGPRLALTDIGRDYQAIVENGLAVIRRGTRRLFGRARDTSVTLSTVPSLVSRWLIPRLGEFQRKHPNVSLRLDATFRMVDFSNEPDIDAAVRYGAGIWPGLSVELLVEDFVVPVCSPRLARRINSIEDLAGHELLTEDPRFDRWEYWLDAVGAATAGRANARISDDFNVQLQAAALGHGIALARGLLVADDLRSGQLVCPLKMAVRSPEQYYFVCAPERLSDSRIQAIR
ncbi:MAG TPA: transcriptional regulator GcvA, partial [Gammaproteobacteria bacterium]|nr:transcriptional regulator GcvA [Gammaproteobacteria bacterium]